MLKGVNESTHGSSCYLEKTVSSPSGFTQMRIPFILFVQSPSHPHLYVFLHWFSATKCQVQRSPTRVGHILHMLGMEWKWHVPSWLYRLGLGISTPLKCLPLAWTGKYQARMTFYHFRIFLSFFFNSLFTYLSERECTCTSGRSSRGR